MQLAIEQLLGQLDTHLGEQLEHMPLEQVIAGLTDDQLEHIVDQLTDVDFTKFTLI